MNPKRVILVLCLGLLAFPRVLRGQAETSYEIVPLTPQGVVEVDFKTGTATSTDGILLRYGDTVLTADRATWREATGEVVADGHVRIQRNEQIWASEHIRYNFRTRQIESQQFRTGKAPVFAAGDDLTADVTNQVYRATNAIVTTDNISTPAYKVRAHYIRIIPGQRIEARNAVLYLEGVPVFYFPYYSRNLNDRVNHFSFVPGYRSSYGPFLLVGYTWFLTDQIDGEFHADYRVRRGGAGGVDVNYHFGPWGDGSAKYYYLRDEQPDISGHGIPHDRQRVDFSYQANPATNLFLKSRVRYQSDTNILRDFLEREYGGNPQPNTFIDANRFWQNFSLDTYVEPRANNFLEIVERLPEVKLTGFRQEVGPTPIYYESESSAGYYRRLFPQTNGISTGLDYSAARADSLQQLLLPETFFGWLNFTPRAGGRFTYYGEASGPGGFTQERYRGVFNTGAELNFKASKLWSDVRNDALDLDGVRHIVVPSVNYVYVPSPSYHPDRLPQFDTELPSLRLLPIDFPDYNAIDSIDSQNTVRLGLFNKFQTKRHGEVVDFTKWDLYTDWRLDPRADQTRFADVYSDFQLKPRSWLTLESLTRYDPEDGIWRMAIHSITFSPNDVWSWSLTHFYLRDDTLPPFTGLGIGNNLVTSTFFYRVNENWGARLEHRFEARDGRMQEQAYTIYRDLRSWTAALTFRVVDSPTRPMDYTVAFTFSLKAFPRFTVGSDVVRPYSLLGG